LSSALFAGEVIRAPAKNGIKLNATALPTLDC
jgi:hypothetical protein